MGVEWHISWHPHVKPLELDETIRRVAAATLHFTSTQEMTLAGSFND